MSLGQKIWHYWKWLCVALMSTFVVLALLAALITEFKKPSAGQKLIGQCIDSGGTWDDAAKTCTAAG